MVSTDIVRKAGLPAGEYQIIAWDLDTTGRRLIDEFCHIAGYTPENQFSQFVMPYKDLDLISKRRHQMRTVTVGKYRMLKDLKTGKFLKTKSEVSALQDFLTWLEEIKGESGPGVILLAYETFKLAPSLILEALQKYQLLDRFREVVKGFGDCYGFVKQKCDATLTSFSLKVVSKVLLDKEDEITSASDRARLAYEVVQHLTAGESGGEGDAAGLKVMVDAIREHSTTIDEELQIIEEIKVVLNRQNTLRPVFGPIMRLGIQERKSASALRRLLTSAFLDYDTLKALWDDGREKLEEAVKSKLSEATQEQRNEILKMLSDHFDPNVPKPTFEKKSRNNRKNDRRNKDQASSDIPTTPETTESNTSPSSPSKSNGTITPKVESPKHEPEVKVEVKQEQEANASPKTVLENSPFTSQGQEVQNTSASQDSQAKVTSQSEAKSTPPSKQGLENKVLTQQKPEVKVSPQQKPQASVSPQNKPEVKVSPQHKPEAKVTPHKTESKISPKLDAKVSASKKEPESKVSPKQVTASKVSSRSQESGVKVAPRKQEPGVKVSPPKEGTGVTVSTPKPELEVKVSPEQNIKIEN